MGNRIQKVRETLQANHASAILITKPTNITYLTDFPFLSPTEREAYLLITHAKQYIISSFLYKEELQKKAPAFTFLDISSAGGKPWWEHAKDIAEREHLAVLGFEAENLTVAEYSTLRKQHITLQPLSISFLRDVKDSQEIAAIVKACAVADNAFKKIQKDIHPHVTEKELAQKLDSYMQEEGATPSFATIVAFGKNAAVPHHVTDETMLSEKDIILLDFGAKINNYCSDMTRMVFMGKPTDKEQTAYDILLSAQQRALDFLFANKPPFAASAVDEKARDYIVEKGFPSFSHSLGHSIGIETHDGFRLSPISKTQLVSGMVFSVEPGIYIPGEFGMRIEDIVALTQNGPELLTKSPREITIM